MSDLPEDSARRKIMEELHRLLHKIGKEVTELRVETTARARHVQALLDDHHETIYGSESSPGMQMKIDRLEQRDKNREKHFWAIWIAAMGAIATAVASFFHPK